MNVLELCSRTRLTQHIPKYKEAIESLTREEFDEDIAQAIIDCFEVDSDCYGEGLGVDNFLLKLVPLLDELQGRRDGEEEEE